MPGVLHVRADGRRRRGAARDLRAPDAATRRGQSAEVLQGRRRGRDADRDHAGSGEARHRARVQGEHRSRSSASSASSASTRAPCGRARSSTSATRASRSRSRTVPPAGQGAARDSAGAARRHLCAVAKVEEIHYDAVLHDSPRGSLPPRADEAAAADGRPRDRAGQARRRAEAVGGAAQARSSRIRACRSSTTRARTRPCCAAWASCTCA